MGYQVSTAIFIQKAISKHGNKYDYSLVDYKSSHAKVKIICPIHGVFEQIPNNHYYYGCGKCGGTKKYDVQEFTKRAKILHNNKYDYSKVIYKNNSTKVIIICPIHGEFMQTPAGHLVKRGCKKCANELISKNFIKTTEQFIIDAKKVHKDRYDYSLVNYIDSITEVDIICRTHKMFKQTPANHLSGRHCYKCAKQYKECYNKNDLPVYETYAPQLEFYNIECRRYKDDENILEIKCHYCKRWFIPFVKNVQGKITSANKINMGESNLYCSDICKNLCPTFNQVLYPKDKKPYKSTREVQKELKELRLKIDNNVCQVCFSKDKLQCHHYDGVELNPIESADLDRCITLCKSCHKELHKVPGYTYQDYRRKPCII